jgi:hypothetical protein
VNKIGIVTPVILVVFVEAYWFKKVEISIS